MPERNAKGPGFGTYIVLLSEEDNAKVIREAEETGMVPEAWIAWLVHDYAPPQFGDEDAR